MIWSSKNKNAFFMSRIFIVPTHSGILADEAIEAHSYQIDRKIVKRLTEFELDFCFGLGKQYSY